MYRIEKEFTIDMAHIVTTQDFCNSKYKCKCKNIHGHTFTIIPIIESEFLGKNRMVLDYTVLSEFKNILDSFLDHKLIIAKKNMKNNLIEGDSFEIKLKFEVPDKTYHSFILDKIVFKDFGSITVVDWDSTTAEDLSKLLKYILAEQIMISFEYTSDLQCYVAIKETPKSYAIHTKPFTIKYDPLKTMKYIVDKAFVDTQYKAIYNFFNHVLKYRPGLIGSKAIANKIIEALTIRDYDKLLDYYFELFG